MEQKAQRKKSIPKPVRKAMGKLAQAKKGSPRRGRQTAGDTEDTITTGVAVDYKRQVNLFNPADYEMRVVTIVGLGNIGSHSALSLARLGIKQFEICDNDSIEAHNLSSQAFPHSMLGKTKTYAIQKQIEDLNPNARVYPRTMLFQKWVEVMFGEEINDVLVIAVDSMEARRKICKTLQKKNLNPKFIIDGRIGGRQLEVYTCTSVDEWEKTFTDGASVEPCGGRYISYVSAIIGGIITNQVKKVLRELPYDKSIMMDVDSLQVVKNFEW